jgi:4-hydroxy-3-polyprenylbenzoate decarboxylase
MAVRDPDAGRKRLVVAITGASGAMYGLRFLQCAEPHCSEIYLALSDQAVQVIKLETGRDVAGGRLKVENLIGQSSDVIRIVNKRDYFTPPASGSFRHDGMVIVPCSMGTAGRIANGISDDLITRAADVCLKEKRPLILVPRETPWNLIQLRNLTQLAEAGATILPACPGFYHQPQSIGDLVDHVVARILQQVGIEHRLVAEWRHEEADL